MNKMKENLIIRICTMDDLEAVMELQDRINKGMNNPDWFAATSREENIFFLQEPNTIYGVFDRDKLIAYSSIGFPGKEETNLGWDLGWPQECTLRCATLDTIVVDKDYRGMGLQRTLIQLCVKHVKQIMPDCIVLTTICPDNIYSLRNAQAEGFEVLMRKLKYGGVDRYILGLE